MPPTRRRRGDPKPRPETGKVIDHAQRGMFVQKPAGRSGRVQRITQESIRPEDTPRA